eukprot:436833_1
MSAHQEDPARDILVLTQKIESGIDQITHGMDSMKQMGVVHNEQKGHKFYCNALQNLSLSDEIRSINAFQHTADLYSKSESARRREFEVVKINTHDFTVILQDRQKILSNNQCATIMVSLNEFEQSDWSGRRCCVNQPYFLENLRVGDRCSGMVKFVLYTSKVTGLDIDLPKWQVFRIRASNNSFMQVKIQFLAQRHHCLKKSNHYGNDNISHSNTEYVDNEFKNEQKNDPEILDNQHKCCSCGEYKENDKMIVESGLWFCNNYNNFNKNNFKEHECEIKCDVSDCDFAGSFQNGSVDNCDGCWYCNFCWSKFCK